VHSVIKNDGRRCTASLKTTEGVHSVIKNGEIVIARHFIGSNP